MLKDALKKWLGVTDIFFYLISLVELRKEKWKYDPAMMITISNKEKRLEGFITRSELPAEVQVPPLHNEQTISQVQ